MNNTNSSSSASDFNAEFNALFGLNNSALSFSSPAPASGDHHSDNTEIQQFHSVMAANSNNNPWNSTSWLQNAIFNTPHYSADLSLSQSAFKSSSSNASTLSPPMSPIYVDTDTLMASTSSSLPSPSTTLSISTQDIHLLPSLPGSKASSATTSSAPSYKKRKATSSSTTKSKKQCPSSPSIAGSDNLDDLDSDSLLNYKEDPLPPLILDGLSPEEMKRVKRERNTEIARRSRARKAARTSSLEEEVKRLAEEKRAILSQIVNLQQELTDAKTREIVLLERMKMLENLFAFLPASARASMSKSI
jgi:hypothetical protein